jgi:hypothetical protein|nr:hypothetical protein [Kofleriaceae bacterium]
MKLAISVFVALALTAATPAAARGIDFHIFETPEVTAETARVLRCPDDVEPAARKAGTLASCRPVHDGWLAGIVDGSSLRVELVTAKRTVAWRRSLPGKVAFANGLLVVLEAGTGYRAIWLAETDGHVVRDLAFTAVTGAARDKLTIPDCGDQVDAVLRSPDPHSLLAAVCVVLD